MATFSGRMLLVLVHFPSLSTVGSHWQVSAEKTLAHTGGVSPAAWRSICWPSKRMTCLCFQMQPFDLLGITIKSLAEIEKEVSGPPGKRGRGARARAHSLALWPLSPVRGHARNRRVRGPGHFSERSAFMLLKTYCLQKETPF